MSVVVINFLLLLHISFCELLTAQQQQQQKTKEKKKKRYLIADIPYEISARFLAF